LRRSLPNSDDSPDGAPLDEVITAALPAPRPATDAPACPVDRLPRRQRNKLCIWIIALGLLNFLIYTVTYAALGGDAHNGYIKRLTRPDGAAAYSFIVRGHFVRTPEGLESEVSRKVWIYSYLHSITVPLTSGALIISMLVLARPHILATMRGGLISGQTFVTSFGTIVILATLVVTVLFTTHFVAQLWTP
jgi:hypothetical protein